MGTRRNSRRPTLRDFIRKARQLSEKTGFKKVYYVYEDPDEDRRGVYRIGTDVDLDNYGIDDRYIVATSHD